MIGRTLEHYRIEAKLGEGGMGVVYKGHDPRLGRSVAIKVLPPDKVVDAAAKERFVREARAASALNHPGIVTIHDIRSDEGIDFIVMELIEGTTLDALIPAKGLPAPQLLRFATQIADALAAAHGAGILHRDLKPSNVMVTADGRIKILDFGLAKLLDPADSVSETRAVVQPLTEAQTLLGTAAYMSPEQVEGRKLDVRSDVFSLGTVLYEVATGERPFRGDSRISLLHKIVNDDPKPPSEIVPAMPPDLEKLILRCLRKDPGRRFQTMADLRAAIEDVALDTDVRRSQAVTGWRQRRRWALVALAGALVLAGLYVAWTTRRSSEPPPVLRAQPLTTLPGQELYPAFAADGNHIAFSWNGPRQDNTDIYVQQIGAGSPLRLTTDPRVDYNPVWSRDGRWIAFLRGEATRPLATSDREVRLIAPLGGSERKLVDVRVQEIADSPIFLTWCPDNSCVIVTDTTGEGKPDALFTVSLETGEKKQLTKPQPPAVSDSDPSISPDGSTLLFLRRSTWVIGDLFAMPLGRDMSAAGDARPISIPKLKPESAAWTPDGGSVLFSSGALTSSAALWTAPAAGGEAERLPFVGEDGAMPTFSRAEAARPARLAYVRSFTDENIWRIDTAGSGAPASTPGSAAIVSTKADIHPQLSPDGRRVAFTSTRSGNWEIWVSDLDGANGVQITSLNAPTGTGAPSWSRDGKQLVFASDAEGQFDIFVVPSEGGRPRNITSHPAFDHVPIFSRDGNWIYFSSLRSGQFQIWKVPAAGGNALQVTQNGGWASHESIDGEYLYFQPTAGVGAPTDVWRIPIAGGGAVKVLEGALNGAFAVADGGIYYVKPLPKEPEIQFFEFAGRKTVTIARGLGVVNEVGGFSASPDGRTILYDRRDAAVDDLMLVENFRIRSR